MTDPVRILVARSPKQQAIFRIEADQMEAALARNTLPLPPIAFTIRETDEPDFPEQMDRAFAMIGWQFPLDLITANKGALRLIQLTGAGVEHLLPLDWLPEHIALANASGIHAAKVEEWAMMVFLMLHSEMPHFATAQRAHLWSKKHSGAIAGRKALIFGVGGIGGSLARAAKRLGIETTGVRRNPAPAEHFDSVIGMAEAKAALGDYDFVLLATPLTPETKGLMSAEAFARMRPGAGFANFGRGGLVDQDALIATLKADHLGGAVLDVTTPEPLPPDSPLWDAPRLLITPHVSCDDPDTYVPDALSVFLDNIHRHLNGLPVRNRVDPTRGY